MISGTERLTAALASRYHLLEELGRGGTATVYLAEDLRHPRRVAVKVLRRDLIARDSVERFLREIRFGAQLQHPHILPLLDSGEADGFLYFVMPFVEGESLRDRLRREGQLPVPEVLRILADVVDAVAHAHQRGVVHRDIKPENILLAGRHAVVTDFGVARALRAAGEGEEALTQGIAIGTPAYMAPEQATADPGSDHRVDIYAIGVLGYELLAGRPPFTGGTAQEILTAHVVLTPEPVTSFRRDAPPGLVAIIQRCLAKKPQDRFQQASDLLEELDPLVTPSGGTTPAGSAPVSPLRRRGLRWLVAGAAVVLAGLAVSLVRNSREPTAAGQSRQLTFRGDVLEAALSPDGQFLAFVHPAGHREALSVQDLRGGGVLQLAEGDRLRRLWWSKDGTEIRFLRAADSVNESVAVPRLGGPVRVVSAAGVPSPDGSLVAAIPTSGGLLRVIDVERGDSTLIRVPVGRDFAAGLSWSPRGDRLALRTISPLPGHAAIYVVVPATRRVVEILRDTTWLTQPGWGPDGSDLYFLRRMPGGGIGLWRVGIAPNGRARGGPELLATGLREPDFESLLSTRVDVAADGGRVLYRAIDTRSNLARIALDGPPDARGLHPLTTGTAQHPGGRISPDGRTIALIRREGKGVLIGTMPLEGGPIRPLATLLDGYDLAWSPDGSALVVSGKQQSDSTDALHVFSLSGGTQRRFAAGQTSWGVEWGSDGRIVHMRSTNRGFGLLDPRTGADSAVARPDSTGWVFWPRLSPGAREIAYAWNPETGRLAVWSMALEGGTPRRVTPDGWVPLRYTPDGKRILAARLTFTQDAVEVAVFPPSGPVSRPLVRLPRGMRALDVTPDGRTLLLSVREHRSDVWEVTLPPR
ncbi:MAG TPA: protein kinase [Gemmatimonadales bacterium]|nr:protein kinase [Gemmatimonadales bacterium]